MIYVIVYLVGAFICLLGFSVLVYDEWKERKSDPTYDYIKEWLLMLALAAVWPLAVLAGLLTGLEMLNDMNLSREFEKVIKKLKSKPQVEVVNFKELNGQQIDAELTRLYEEQRTKNN